MKGMFSQISITGTTNTGIQVLKKHLTQTEKKVLLHMLNNNMQRGIVRNKSFQIVKTQGNEALAVVGTKCYSEILRKHEVVYNKVEIKYS